MRAKLIETNGLGFAAIGEISRDVTVSSHRRDWRFAAPVSCELSDKSGQSEGVDEVLVSANNMNSRWHRLSVVRPDLTWATHW